MSPCVGTRPVRYVSTTHFAPAMRRLQPIDGLLLVVMLVWGGNFSIVKAALDEVPRHAFNSLRLILATALLLTTLMVLRVAPGISAMLGPGVRRAFTRSERLSAREWGAVAALGLVGHLGYQLCFIGGLARTTAANSALIIGSTPILVALIAVILGVERVGVLHWIGTLLSMVGVSLVVGLGDSASGGALTGNLLVLGATVCWAIYTVASRPLLARHSPLVLTAYSMAFGTIGYVVVRIEDVRELSWLEMSGSAWAALTFSAVFALYGAYLVWYAAIQQLGSSRTSIYANLVPVVGVAVAVLWLDEPARWPMLIGATAIVVGVGLTRGSSVVRNAPPPEE